MKQAKGDAGETGVGQRPLPLDDHPVRALGRIADHALRRAGDEVGNDGVDRDAVSGDGDAGLPRGDERGSLARALERAHDLQGRGHLPHRGIGADRENDRRAFAGPAMTSDGQVYRRLSELAHGPAAAPRGVREGGVRQHPLVQSVPDLKPACERPRERGPVGVRDAAAGRRRPDDQRPGAERRRLLDARDDRHASSDTHAVRRILARARRVHDRNDRERRVTQDPDGGLRGCGRELALGEDRQSGGCRFVLRYASGGPCPRSPIHAPPRSGPRRRNRPPRSRVVSPDSRAMAPRTSTWSIPTGKRCGSS